MNEIETPKKEAKTEELPLQKLSKKVLLIISAIMLLLTLTSFTSVYLYLQERAKNQQSYEENETNDNSTNNSNPRVNDQGNNSNSNQDLSEAEQAGLQLSNNKCSGTGPVQLKNSPMKPEDFEILIPYGLMVGGHVTPIDHQYFSPKEYNSPRDSYDVMTMADGYIVDIGPRDRVNPNDPNDKFQEYRIVFMHTCTFFTYYDLVTSLSPDLKEEYDKVKSSNGYAGSINFKVEAGQVIGKIGGQTLDFAVWDTEKPLTGFITPQFYQGESWKIYTANPYDYMTEELKQFLIERNPRTVEPIEGKIDYDIDGKLIGNWFIEGSGGYVGGAKQDYWETHLAIAPDHFDPTKYIISFGDYEGEAKQFVARDNNFNPANLGVENGLQEVELGTFNYKLPNGLYWDRKSLVKSPTIEFASPVEGCVLFEMVEARKLKMEVFPSFTCNAVSGFTGDVKVYER